jgi:soluble lytic murein transglycosylase-like protein
MTMLENMNKILERIDGLNQGFKGMAHKRARRQQQTFAAAMIEATKTPVSAGVSASPATNPAATNIANNIKSDVETLIDKYSKEHNLSPQLVQQLIAVASGNNPQAVDSNGNAGLMQIKPEIFSQLGGQNPLDPEQNIKAGTKDLSDMLQRNGGDVSLALAAYNSDPATVKRFGGVPPFPSTQNFVSQVLSGLGSDDKKK